MVNIKADKLAEEIRKALDDTKSRTDTAMRNAVDKTAKQTVSTIKQKAPVRTGVYKKGWTSKKTTDNGRGVYGRTVHNRPRYMIAHLLQNGHGGPHPAKAIPHIPPDEETDSLFIQNMESELKK